MKTILVIQDSTWEATWRPLAVESPLRTESTQRCPCESFAQEIAIMYYQPHQSETKQMESANELPQVPLLRYVAWGGCLHQRWLLGHPQVGYGYGYGYVDGLYL